MATTKPRLTVTLKPSTHLAIKRLAKIQRRSSSSIISEAMDEMAPVINKLTDLFDKAKKMEQGLFKGFAEEAEDMANDAEETKRIFTMLLSEIEQQMDEKNPRPVIRGSEPLQPAETLTTPKTIHKKKGKKKCTKRTTKTH